MGLPVPIQVQILLSKLHVFLSLIIHVCTMKLSYDNLAVNTYPSQASVKLRAVTVSDEIRIALQAQAQVPGIFGFAVTCGVLLI